MVCVPMYPAPPLIKICLFPVLGTVGTGGNTVEAAEPTALNIIGDNNDGNKERKVVSDDEIDPPAVLFATTELNNTQTTTTRTICRVETMSILQESVVNLKVEIGVTGRSLAIIRE